MIAACSPSAEAQSSRRCDRFATPETLATQVREATADQVICLAAGDYGKWRGADRPLTLTSQGSAVARIALDFNTGVSGVTIDGLTITLGRIVNGARDITVRNSAFTGPLTIDNVQHANILLDNNTHININSCVTCTPAAIHLAWSSEIFSGVTVQNSLFRGGNADGIQAGTGLNILNNRFIDIAEHGYDELHTDAIQLIFAKGAIVRGNYIHRTASGIVAYDGIDSAIIEDNVVDIANGRWGIELYADKGSIVRHNTLLYRTTCAYAPCGHIILSRKPKDPAGVGTIIENNIATVITMSNGSKAAINRNNMLVGGATIHNFVGKPTYKGGAAPATYAGFELAAGSMGKGRATGGLDVGIRANLAAPASQAR